MTSDTKTERAALLRAATLVRAALSNQSYVPALMHIAFDGEWATAFNTRMAIAVRCDANIRRMIPGTLLVQGLNSFGGKEVLLQQAEDDSFVLKSGRSKVTLPTLPLSAFPFKWPDQRSAMLQLAVTDDMASAIKRCLISVNKDASQPAQMGVTFDMTDSGKAVFFSTDNGSLSRCECSKDKVTLPGEAPVIMPLAFCEQLVSLADAFPHYPPTMFIGNGWLEVQYDASEGGALEARLFTTMPVDLDPTDFPKAVRRHCGDLASITKRTTVIPESLEPALARALLVLGNEQRKKAMATVDRGALRLRATSQMGEADDTLDLDIDDVGPVPIEVGLIARGIKHATRIGINETVTILVGGERHEFVHMVAHVRENKQ